MSRVKSRGSRVKCRGLKVKCRGSQVFLGFVPIFLSLAMVEDALQFLLYFFIIILISIKSGLH